MIDQFIPALQKSLDAYWDLPAFTDYKGQTRKFSEVAHTIAQLHLLYKELGLAIGDKVVLVGRNQGNWGTTIISLISYGLVGVPIMNDFKPDAIVHVTEHSDARFIICGDQIWESISASSFPALLGVLSLDTFKMIRSTNEIQTFWQAIDQKMEARYPKGFDKTAMNYYQADSESMALINYTSGTTGFSKGVMVPYRALWANIDYGMNVLPALEPGDSVVSMLPLGHMFGLMFELFFCFCKGCHITFLTKTPSPQVVMEAFANIRPRFIITVPLVVEKIYKRKILPSLDKPLIKFLLKVPGIQQIIYKKINKELRSAFGNNFFEMVVGGAAFNPEIEAFFMKIKFPLALGYGMTECAPLISYANWKMHKYLSCGKPMYSIEVKIDSADQANIVGEILTRGPHVMLGYYKDPEATAAILADGWLHTGDLGVMDSDQNIFIRGRSKSLILGPSGQNIYPEEIENILNNLPGVVESIVVDRNGKLIALVYPDPEMIAQQKLTPEAVSEMMEQNRKLLNSKLVQYSHVANIELISEEFEKTSKRSIKRFLYR